MLKLITGVLMLFSVNSFAQRPVDSNDLKGTCWGTQLGGYHGKFWSFFIFREDGSGEIRKIEKFRGVISQSALSWKVANGILTYTFQEPQSGSIGLSGTGLQRSAIISNDGKSLSVERVQGSPWYLSDCDGLQ